MFEEYKDIVTVEELCAMLRVSKNTGYGLIKNNAIPYIRIGQQIRIPKKEVIKYMDASQEDAAGLG